MNKLLLAMITMIVFLLFLMVNEPRKKVYMLESGLKLTKSLRPYLCKYQHKSFLANDSWRKDDTGHGTVMAETISRYMDPDRECLVIYKMYDGKPQQKAYLDALKMVADKGDATALVVAITDVTFDTSEVELYSRISKFSEIFVSSGNERKVLRKGKCDVFPACLKLLVKSPNFKVVGANVEGYNHGPLVDENHNPKVTIKGTTHDGTSISTARAAGEYLSSL